MHSFYPKIKGIEFIISTFSQILVLKNKYLLVVKMSFEIFKNQYKPFSSFY